MKGNKLQIMKRSIALFSAFIMFNMSVFSYGSAVISGNEEGTPTCEDVGHDYTEATCTESAVCSVCGEVVEEALGHDYNDATCIEPSTCSRCGETEGEALGHEFTDATCEDAKTCSVCGEIDGDALGHNYETEEICGAVCITCGYEIVHDYNEATCLDASVCSICEEIIEEALGHTWSDATCIDAKTCSVCGETEGVALGHAEGEEATCTDAQVCTRCEEVLEEALGHDYGENAICGALCIRCDIELEHQWVEATCVNAKTCDRCGEIEGEALGHAWIEATCIQSKTCSVCEATEGEALGHVEGDAATCTDAQVCTRCEEVLVEALGHRYETEEMCGEVCATCEEELQHEWIEATCVDASICSRCDVINGEALGHDYVEATCLDAKTCDRCGEIDGEALGHNYIEDENTGVKICNRCGEVENNEIEDVEGGTVESPVTSVGPSYSSSPSTLEEGGEEEEIAAQIVVDTFESSGTNKSYARIDDTVTLIFYPTVKITIPTVTIAGIPVTPTDEYDDGTCWIAELDITEERAVGIENGVLEFYIKATTFDTAEELEANATFDGSIVTFDKTKPVFSFIDTVSYGGIGEKTASVTMEINDEGSTINKIERYDGTSWTNIIPSGFIAGKVGKQTVTVNFTQTGTFKFRLTDMAGNVSEESAEVVVTEGEFAIEIKTLPNKMEYKLGNSIDLTGGVLNTGTVFGEPVEVDMTDTNITTVGFDSNTVGQKTIDIKYNNATTSMVINVVENISYFELSPNGSETLSNSISTTVTIKEDYRDGFTDTKYLWSYSKEDIGTKLYKPKNDYKTGDAFNFSGEIITNPSVGTDNTGWFLSKETLGGETFEIFRSPKIIRDETMDKTARETIIISTNTPNSEGIVSFDYTTDSAKYHKLNVWINDEQVISGMSGSFAKWHNYTNVHETDENGKITIILEYFVSKVTDHISDNHLVAIKELSFEGSNEWKSFSNGDILTTDILGPETYLYVKGVYDGRTITEISNSFNGDAGAVVGIKIKTVPGKTQYIKGDALELDAGEVTLIYERGEKKISIEDNRIGISDGYDMNKTGVQKIYVTYGNFTASYIINVIEERSSNNVNPPILDSGMVPVKWFYDEEDKEGYWVVTTEDDKEWYDYSSSERKWANVMLRDNLVVREIPDATDVSFATVDNMAGKRVLSEGSLFVWIPRFSYKIENGSAASSGSIETSGTITKNYIKWTIGTDDYKEDGYLKHPAFYYGAYYGGDPNSSSSYSANGVELKGFWVAKFEASNKKEKIKIKADERAWNNIGINDAFENSKKMVDLYSSHYGIEDDVISHLIKNSEWGAVTILSNGHDGTGYVGMVPYINNYNLDGAKTGYSGGKLGSEGDTKGTSTYMWNTKEGYNASTTHNIYGVYDMSGGLWEHVAGYISNGDPKLSSKGAALLNGSNASDVDVLISKNDYSDDYYDQFENNYYDLENFQGWAMYEFSYLQKTNDVESGILVDDDICGLLGTDDGEYSVYSSLFLIRGGSYDSAAGAGVYAFKATEGEKESFYGFRPTLLIGEKTSSTPEDTEEIIEIYSSNINTSVAKVGDIVTVNLRADKTISIVSATINGNAVPDEDINDTYSNDIYVSREMTKENDESGLVKFSITYTIDGVTKTVTEGDIDTEVYFSKGISGVTGTPSTTVNPNGTVDVEVSKGESSGVPIKEQRWLPGEKGISDFANGAGNSIDNFTVGNGKYTIYTKDAAGNERVDVITINNIDKTPPVIEKVTIKSNNDRNTSFAKKGENIILEVKFDEEVAKPTISILGKPVSGNQITSADSKTWTAVYKTIDSDEEGKVGFSISGCYDEAGNEVEEEINSTTDGSSVVYDNTLVKADFSELANNKITGGNVDFVVSFSDENIEENVDLRQSNIEFITTSGNVEADIVIYGIENDNLSKKITVTNITGDGAFKLKVKNFEGHILACDKAGNLIEEQESQEIIVDTIVPVINSVVIRSNNVNSSYATNGDTITVEFISSEEIFAPRVSIFDTEVTPSNVSGDKRTWKATYRISESEKDLAEGEVPFEIYNYYDDMNNLGDKVERITSGNNVIYDRTNPVTQIGEPEVTVVDNFSNRKVSYKITYNDNNFGISMLDVNDVNLITTGNVVGTITIDEATGNERLVTITGIEGVGSLGISLASGTAKDMAGNLATATETSGLVEVDTELPTLETQIYSTNENQSYAKIGDIVTLNIVANEDINAPTVTINGKEFAKNELIEYSSTRWEAKYTLTSVDIEGHVNFTISYTDLMGNAGETLVQNETQVVTTDSSYVIFDKTLPVINLSHTPTEETNGYVEIATNIVDVNEVVVKKYLAGEKSLIDVSLMGENIIDDKFEVSSNGFYTVYAKDIAGNENVAMIKIDNIDDIISALKTVNIFPIEGTDQYVKQGETIRLQIVSDEAIEKPSISINGNVINANDIINSAGDNMNWVVDYVMSANDDDGKVDFTINYTDLVGNIGPQITKTTDDSKVIYDKTLPAITIVSGPDKEIVKEDDKVIYKITITEINEFTFDESKVEIVGDATADISIVGAADSRTITLNNFEGNGTIGLIFKQGLITDIAGNLSFEVMSETFVVDTTNPVITAAATSDGINTAYAKNGSQIIIVMNSDTPIYTAPTVSVGGRTADVVWEAGRTSGTATYTIPTDEIFMEEGRLDVSISGYKDLAGNTGEEVTNLSSYVFYDKTNPSIQISPDGGDYTDVSVEVTLNDPLSNSYYSGINNTTIEYAWSESSITTPNTFEISNAIVNGKVTISSPLGLTASRYLWIKAVSDKAGNLSGTYVSKEFKFNNTSPIITISEPSVDKVNNTSVSYTISYVGASKITLSPTDIKLNATGNATGTVSVLGSGNTLRTVTISNISGNGTIGISIYEGSAVNSSGVLAGSAGPSATVMVDNNLPAVTFSPNGSTVAKSHTVQVSISDNIINGVASGLSDQNVYGYAWSTSSSSAPTTWKGLSLINGKSQITTEGLADGTHYLWINSISDSVGNVLEAVHSEEFVINNVNPLITVTAITTNNANNKLANNGNIITINMSVNKKLIKEPTVVVTCGAENRTARIEKVNDNIYKAIYQVPSDEAIWTSGTYIGYSITDYICVDEYAGAAVTASQSDVLYKNIYNVTLSKVPGDTAGTITGQGSYKVGSVVTIVATDVEATIDNVDGCKFERWDTIDVNIPNPTIATRSFVMPAKDVDIVAYFTKLWTVQFVDYDNSVLKTQVVEEGGSAVAPPNPSYSGYTFRGWDKEFDNVTANLTVKAVRAQNTHKINVKAVYNDETCQGNIVTTEDGSDVVIDRNSQQKNIYVEEFSDKEFVINCETGTEAIVYVDGYDEGMISSYIFEDVDESHTIKVEFRTIEKPKITASVGYKEEGKGGYVTTEENGTVATLNASNSTLVTEVSEGSSKTYTITSEPGYTATIYIDGVPVGVKATYTFTDITESHTIHIYFENTIETAQIIFNPNGAEIEEVLSTCITGQSIKEGSLQYIVSNSSLLPNVTITNFVNNDVYEFEGDWEQTSLTLGSDTEAKTVYRSKSVLATNSDSMAMIEMTSLGANNVSFDYYMSAASSSYFGITINGTEFELSGNSDWQEFNQTIEPNKDGKIIIGLTYSKGSTASGSDLAAIKNLVVGLGWQAITSGTTVTSGALGMNTYIHAKGLSEVTLQEVSAISQAFTVANNKYPKCSVISTASTGGTITPLGEKLVKKGDSQAYVITPNVGYKIKALYIDGVTRNVTNVYTTNVFEFTSIGENHTIEVVFEETGN